MSTVVKASDLRQKSIPDLKEERVALLREQFNLRMQKANGQLSKPHQFKQVRRSIARINMVLGERYEDKAVASGSNSGVDNVDVVEASTESNS